MEVFDGRYYKICKRSLTVIGLWPYDKRYKRILKNIIFTSINISLALPQAILLVKTRGKHFNITVENIVSLMFAFACMIKYIIAYLNSKQLELLLLQVSKDWIRLKDKEEHTILSKYGEEGRVLVIFYTVYLLFAWMLYSLVPLGPVILDHLLPLPNGTRPIFFPFYADYIFFDQLNYHYWCCLHITVVYFTSFFLYSGVDGIFVLTVKHTCGLFGITCNRIEKAVKCDQAKFFLKLNKDPKIPHKLSKAVALHTDSIRCYNLLEDSFSRCFLIVFVLSVTGAPLAVLYVKLNIHDVLRSGRIIAFVIGIAIHLFYLNYIGQQVIDSSEQVFDTSYNSDWYLTSTKARKFTNIIMIRTLTPCILTAGKITTLSMNSFGVILKTCMSYFTMFLSVTE